MDYWKQTILLFALASFGLIAAQVTLARNQGSGIDMKKRIYSIRKQTLTTLKTYAPPSRSQRDRMTRAVTETMSRWTAGELPADADPFAPLPFAISFYKSRKEELALIHEQEGRLAGGGLYLLRKQRDSRCEVLMAPHGFFDVHTGRLSVDAFFGTRADALLLNSAHRYTGNREMKIDKYGTDLAHREDNYYFSVFRALADGCSDGTFIQLHGFDQEEHFQSAVRQYDIILSAGNDVGTAVDRSKQASAIFKKIMPDIRTAVYGIDFGGALGGETNVHKKYLQGKPGMLFLHIEMNTNFRRRLVEHKGDKTRFFQCLDQLLKMKKDS